MRRKANGACDIGVSRTDKHETAQRGRDLEDT